MGYLERSKKNSILNAIFGESHFIMPIDPLTFERLKQLATAAATTGNNSVHEESEYAQIRRDLMSDVQLKDRLPRFILVYSNLKEVRRDMQELAPSYKERSEFIRKELSPFITGTLPRDPFQEVVAATDLSNLATLPADIQQKGKQGADCFTYLFCIENSIREFIIQVTAGQTMTIPRDVKTKIEARKQSEATRKYLPVRGNSDVYYCDFIELADIMIANWSVFSSHFPAKNEHWLKTMMAELYAVRLLIGHNSAVGDVELRQLDVFYRMFMSYLKLTK